MKIATLAATAFLLLAPVSAASAEGALMDADGIRATSSSTGFDLFGWLLAFAGMGVDPDGAR